MCTVKVIHNDGHAEYITEATVRTAFHNAVSQSTDIREIQIVK